jgi:hypothetical protein
VKLNRGGLIFCAVYLAWFVIFSGLALTTADPKGAYLLAQLSILPGQLVLWKSGLGQLLEAYGPSWIMGPLLTIPLSFVVVYLIGWGMSSLRRGRPQATIDAKNAERE